MTQVTRSNFKDLLPQIRTDIDKAAFIAVDTEFTGLCLNNATKSSLFDTLETRYRKQRQNVRSFTIGQFGLSAFIATGASSYTVHTYNFYVFPVAVANYDQRFTLQASAVHFLSRYGFDFNKMFKEGIPCVNNAQESLLASYWKSNIGHQIDDLSQRDILRHYGSQVAKWLVQARVGDIFSFDKSSLDSGQLPNDIVHEKLVHRFDNVWPVSSGEDVFIFEKIDREKQTQLKKQNLATDSEVNQTLLDENIGFTHVIRHLINRKKTIVGHNMYLDLLFIYDKFIDHLPSNYENFKSRLHDAFPNVFDTKRISQCMRQSMENTGVLDLTDLGGLYTAMSAKESGEKMLFAPSVRFSDSNCSYTKGDIVQHEAGFDSYMCGFVFLRMAHMLSTYNTEKVKSHYPIPYCDYGMKLKPYENCVNVIRARAPFMQLDGKDPIVEIPDDLLVKTKHWSDTINLSEIATLFSQFGSVDIRSHGANQALVAVGHFGCSRRILDAFKNHHQYTVVKYSFWRHSPVMHKLLIGTVLLTSGVCTALLIKKRK